MPTDVRKVAAEQKVQIKQHSVIYHLIRDLKDEISENLPLKDVEEVLGR